MQANAQNIDHINTLLSLTMGGIQEIRNRLRTDLNKFEISLQSPLGWKLVSGMEKYEGSVGTISRADLRLQERSFIQHERLLAESAKSAGAGPSKGAGAKNTTKKGAAKTTAADKAVTKKKGGGVSKPKKGGCHRCGGPHFVRNCDKPAPTPEG